MRMVDLIIKKRQGKELSNEEIYFWIKGYVQGTIADYQTSAMAMAILFNGMSNREVSTLTDAMEHSGDVLDLSNIKGYKVDKHSTGGVGDKTSLVLGPMVAACGGIVAKLSGRGLGHTGGTLDKLESIPGLTTAIEGSRFENQVNSIGIAIAGQTAHLVPADKKMYALRDVTGTVESIPLIAASVMSKKLASGSDGILLDVTVGKGAFMKNLTSARQLAKIMVGIGKKLGRNTQAIISDMNEPLGHAVGNILEVKEAIESLKGNGPKDLMEVCYNCGSIMLTQSKIAKNKQEALSMLENCIKDGSAFNKFVEMVKAQDGDISYILNPDKFQKAKIVHTIIAKKDGYIKKLDGLTVGICSMKLGGGRENLEDSIDYTAGIYLYKKVGDKVKQGDVLCKAFTNKENVDDVINELSKAYAISNSFVKPFKVVKEVIEKYAK